LPVSSDPSFRTTRWVTLSTLRQTTVCPAGNVAGFGEKDCAPLTPTTSIVTALLVGVGVGVGVGIGATAGAGVGAIGLPPYSVELPQPHAHRLTAMIPLATITRMPFLFSTRGCWLSMNADRPRHAVRELATVSMSPNRRAASNIPWLARTGGR
jgi:hypothetical protein